MLAQYPLIAFDDAYSGNNVVQETFTRNGLSPPNIMLSAVDGDVSKAYVAKGLGIAILASVAFDECVRHRVAPNAGR